ncbi:MAG: hypothetical protein COB45_09605 [Gammaproteobacteria bacterium]|nr:MAG: hypothetical protein COB45_09605 [Gammaproteobacteria bacterium]PHR81610.1 MAG: hypothetical protein COA59_15515 [Colwellia sp.]
MKYYFSLHLSKNEFLPYYRGQVYSIVVKSNLGTTIQFPAMHLRSHLSSDGVSGDFCLETQNNKFLSLIKLN